MDTEVSPLVRMIINSPGEPLDRQTKNFFSRHMGYAFDNVKIHTGNEAAKSSNAINAHAYTIGNNIVFNTDKFAPHTQDGKRLLAHELTHVIQQKQVIQKQSTQRQQDILPDFSQGAFDSCGAASVITAIVIHDRQSAGSVSPNTGFVAACNIVLSYFSMHQTSIITGIVSRRHATQQEATDLYWLFRRELLRMRNDSNQPGAVVAERDYQLLAASLYALYVGSTSGLSQAAIGEITQMVGMSPSASSTGGGIGSFTAIISNTQLRGLLPGQIAQISWYVRINRTSASLHAFLIGRLNDGNWFLHDQGTSPATRITAGSLRDLESIILTETRAGRYWLFTGSVADFTIIPFGWTGITILGNASGVTSAATNLLTSRIKVAEIDEGAFTNGSDVIIDSYQNEFYDITSAQSAAHTLSRGGGAIIEMPQGRFVLYSTNLVSDANRLETSIDSSGGGEFTHHRFFHAWLQLRSPSWIGSFFRVY